MLLYLESCLWDPLLDRAEVASSNDAPSNKKLLEVIMHGLSSVEIPDEKIRKIIMPVRPPYSVLLH